MKWLRRLMGLDFPDPVAGQLWRCGWNGEVMRVQEVHIHTSGTPFVFVETWHPDRWCGLPPGWGIGCNYAIGLDMWRRKLKEERRKLLMEVL
jgi:hypothetical protein